jgi:hypothetical protein
MARSRLLKPSFFRNEILAELPMGTRLAFAGLWTLADREGRLEDRPKRIKAELFPWDDVDLSAMLADLAAHGFIDRYTVDGVNVIQIVAFAKHQQPHPREQSSELPAKTQSPEKVVPGREKVVPTTAFSGTGPSVSIAVPIAVPVSKALTDADAPVGVGSGYVFPCRSGEWEAPTIDVAEWELAYPRLDVGAELTRACVWLDANPGRRKTQTGMRRFLVAWLARTEDKRSRANPPPTKVFRAETWAWECPHPEPKCTARGPCHTRQVIEAGRQEQTA